MTLPNPYPEEKGETLPRCNCANCRRWVAELAEPPRVISAAEAEVRNRTYADQRRRHRTDFPHLTKDDLILLEGGE